jgi:S1-C subfamily serine protease
LVGERVSVELPSGTVTATIIGVTGRDHDADPQQEILLDRGFACGDSGSAVLNVDGEIVAVVRNTGGRCGFVNG